MNTRGGVFAETVLRVSIDAPIHNQNIRDVEVSMAIKFGTDGWRALIGEEYTFENVRICAQGTAADLKEQGVAAKGVRVGYDTRFRSGDVAAAAAEVFAANGIPCFLTDRAAPTPVVSYNLVTHSAGGGVVITASHNPGNYNGYKYKPA